MNEKAMQKLELPKIREAIKAHAVSSRGQRMVEELRPYATRYEVERALGETQEAADLLEEKGAPPFEGVYDVLDALGYIEKGGTVGAGPILRIGNILKSARHFKDYVGKEDHHPHLQNLVAGVQPLKSLEEEILYAILGENEIADRASATLFQLRKTLRDKTLSVKDKIQSLVRSNEKYLQNPTYTVRGDRYVIPVKSEHKGHVPGLVHDQSASGQTLFIEPMSLVHLNNEIKELMLKEKAEIERILEALCAKVAQHQSAVRRNAETVYLLDRIFATARYSLSIQGTRPQVGEGHAFHLEEARHPLIDPEAVVPSTIYMKEEVNSIIITGPNTGGKTVTLKTVGLLHLMAMSGILIPAQDGSIIGWFHDIHADIGDEQSIEQSLSTFSSHMTNIVSILAHADKHALVLFDELGAGTDPMEGAALATAILEYLRKSEVKVLATTHYSELKAYALRTPTTVNASVEFDVETLRPTYRLLIGVPGKSNAFLISKRLGLQDDIIDMARSFIDTEALRFEDLIESLEHKNRRASQDAREAEVLKRQLEEKEKALEEKLARIETIRERALKDAREESRKLLAETKEKADELLRKMRNLEGGMQKKDARQELEALRGELRSAIQSEEKQSLPSATGKKAKNFKEGQEVLLSTLNQRVTVLTLPDAKGDMTVQAGIMKITVNQKDLLEAGDSKEERKVRKREARLNLKAVSASTDVRGLDAVEAADQVDRYLDEALLSGLSEVTVIHGVGTGVLKEAIHQLLRHHPHVKKHREGAYGEGGMGVTVVTLK